MGKTCRNCLRWSKHYGNKPDDHRECRNPKFMTCNFSFPKHDEEEEVPCDSVVISFYSGSGKGYVETGPGYGCILFEERQKDGKRSD